MKEYFIHGDHFDVRVPLKRKSRAYMIFSILIAIFLFLLAYLTPYTELSFGIGIVAVLFALYFLHGMWKNLDKDTKGKQTNTKKTKNK